MSAETRSRYRRRKAEGSCQNCGAEAVNGKTRCLPCGRRYARLDAEARRNPKPPVGRRALLLERRADDLEDNAEKLAERIERIEGALSRKGLL